MQNYKKILTGMALVLSATAGSILLTSAETGSGVITDGVYIGDQNIGGMTVQEAKDYVNGQIKALGESVITLQMGDNTVSRTWNDLGLTWKNTDLIDRVSQIGTTGNIIRRYKEQKDLQNNGSNYEIEYSLNEDAAEEFVNSCYAFNSEPVEGSVYVGDDGMLHVEGGTDGLSLNAEDTLASLQEYLSEYQAGDQVIEANYDCESPYLTAELLGQMDDVLGSATTDYSASSADRAQNVENGTSKINGTLLMPGESFSVTAAVVPFTAENGYQLAPSYEAGQVVDSYGGGICQVSTTLYNAVLKSELHVEQRSNHTMLVSYVDPSKDAAIAEGVMDFVFTNDKETPVYISGSAYYGELNFTIFGAETRPSNRRIEFESVTTGGTDPDQNVTLIAKTDQPVGYLAQTSTPHQGLSAELWKNIYVDEVLTDRVQINSSHYQASPAIYEVGVLSDNQALSAAMYGAIGQNDLSQVQMLLANGVPNTTTPETTQSESQHSEAQPEVQQPQEPVQQPQEQPVPEDTWTDPGDGGYEDLGQMVDPPEEDILILE